MSAAPSGFQFEAPREHFFAPSAMLALAVHVLLVAALMLGVHWQSRAPDVVTVELWRSPPEPVARPAPPPEVEPPPPAPAPKPEPRIEKPDIALKAKPKPKPKPEPVAKPKPAPPKPDETMAQRLLAEALQREQQTLAAERARQQIAHQLQREQLAARDRAMQSWIDKITAKVRGNVVLPPDLKGNPQAEVLVTQLPTGEVLDAKLVSTSGHAAYDDAVIRAVLKSSPLPKPDSAALFSRDLLLKFRPKD